VLSADLDRELALGVFCDQRRERVGGLRELVGALDRDAQRPVGEQSAAPLQIFAAGCRHYVGVAWRVAGGAGDQREQLRGVLLVLRDALAADPQSARTTRDVGR
jgi:hypothetical protein